MSFDDVARRMKSRHAEGMIPPMDTSPDVVRPAMDADAFAHQLIESERRAAKTRDLTIGGILLGLGLAITLITYDSASQSGGTYVVAYGPMIVGAIRLFKGLAA
ncbi:MAG TPA: hypothetical protein VFV99_03625 [Kofleriaceae bacterium]|nr:hypothetical protein [Kofleriaceae bacterium]